MTNDSPTARVFRYEKPTPQEGGKVLVRIARTERLNAMIQVLNRGGENNLHAHKYQDGLWMVLSGRVRFYGDGDTPIAELGKYEGILIQHGFKYWFESVGDEDLELLQMEASEVPRAQFGGTHDRVDYSPLKEGYARNVMIDARVDVITG